MTPASRERAMYIATIVATLATVFGIGYGLGKDTNDGTINVLRERNSALERTEASLRSENTSIRLELQAARSTGKEDQNPPSIVEGAVKPEQTKSPGSSAKPQKRAELIVKAGTTAQAFDGSVSVSLIGTKYTTSPFRYQAVFSLGGSGKETKVFENIDIGFTSTYAGYSVRLLVVQSDIATFEVLAP